ncbi:MAG: LCP family protein [Ruminococcus sp.]|nr:LCP family protein [Ruminococcus sp.]
MAKKKKSGSIAVPYLLTIFIGIIVVGGGALYALKHLGIIDGDDTLPEPPKRQIATATYEDNHSILFIYDEPSKKNSTSFLLMRSVPKDKKLVFIGIPTNTIAIVDDTQQSMLSAYETGGASGAVNFTNKVFGIEIERYMKVNSAALIKICDILGGVSYPVAEDIAGFNGDGSEQYLNSEQVEKLITYSLYSDGEIERAYIISSVFSAMVNQNVGLRIADNFDTSFKTVINMVDTDITAVDYTKRKTGIKSMLERGNAIASFLIINGEGAYEDFIPDEDFFADLRERYYSYDESRKSDSDE